MKKEDIVAKAQEAHMTTAESLKATGDITSISILGMTFMEAIPDMAAVLTLLWTIIRLYETNTVQRLLKRDPKHRRREDEG